MNDLEIISSFFSAAKSKFLACFSIDALMLKSPSIRREQLKMNLDPLILNFSKDIKELPKDEQVLIEIQHLKKFLKDEIITKNINNTIDNYTRKAIASNFNILELELDKITLLLADDIDSSKEEKKSKFQDVKIKNVELALFIILASKYGLISYNEVTDTEKAKSFSRLTNFSEKSIRNFISGENKTYPNLLKLKEENIDNLKSIIDKISAELASMKMN